MTKVNPFRAGFVRALQAHDNLSNFIFDKKQGGPQLFLAWGLNDPNFKLTENEAVLIRIFDLLIRKQMAEILERCDFETSMSAPWAPGQQEKGDQ